MLKRLMKEVVVRGPWCEISWVEKIGSEVENLVDSELEIEQQLLVTWVRSLDDVCSLWKVNQEVTCCWNWNQKDLNSSW